MKPEADRSSAVPVHPVPADGRPGVPVRLIPIDEALRDRLHDGGEAFTAACGAAIGDHAALVRDVVAQTLSLLATSPRAPEWGGFLAVDAARSVVVGTCGYAHGPEADGTVEIAYFTFPAFEGKGYATAMARVLLDRALATSIVRDVVAHTLPEPNASTRILEKIGLRRAGEAHDPEVGRVWRWACRGGTGAT